jgi:hypothetical protein
LYDEGATTPDFAFNVDSAFVECYHLRDIAKAYAETFHIVEVTGVDAIEFFEDMFLILFADADAVVCHFENGPFALLTGADFYVRLVWRILDGVVDQIVYHIGNVKLVGKKSASDRL